MPFAPRAGESIIIEARPHWLALGPWAIMAAILSWSAWHFWPGWAEYLFWKAFFVIGALTVLGKTIEWSEQRLIVTTERIISRKGFGERAITEIPISQVSEVATSHFDETFVGSVSVRSSGGWIKFEFMPRPGAIRAAIADQLQPARPRQFTTRRRV